VSGPAADPTGAGVPNLLRYALGLDLADDPAPRLPKIAPAATGGAFVFRFPYDTARADLAYVVEVSTDLLDWSDTRFDSRVDPAPRVTDGWAEFELPLPAAGAPARFVRLRVVVAP
jgi:hypothetical protein